MGKNGKFWEIDFALSDIEAAPLDAKHVPSPRNDPPSSPRKRSVVKEQRCRRQ
jgi:hypothetical protein